MPGARRRDILEKVRMTPRQVLYIINNSRQISGAEISLLNLVCGLNADYYRPLVICPEPGALTEQLIEAGVEVTILPLKLMTRTYNPAMLADFSLNQAKFSQGLLSILNTREVDLIHTFSLAAQLYATPAVLWRKIPCVWSMLDILNYRQFNRPFVTIASTLPKRIIADSQAGLDSLLAYGVQRSKLALIYNGFDVDAFFMAANGDQVRQALDIPPYCPVVLAGGQFAEWKGHHVFLLAARLVLDRLPNAHFVLAGNVVVDNIESRAYRDRILALIEELNLQAHITLPGFYRDFPGLLASAQVFVHSAIRPDAAPSVIWNAMLAGKPVIGTRLGGVPEQIINNLNGFLIPPDDPSAMAEAIFQILSNPVLANRMGAVGRARAKELVDRRSFVDRIQHLYDAVAP